MKRTLRNGIAVAAMTGGLWFLGQATAGASDEINLNQNNETSNSASASGGEDKGDSGAAAGSLQKNDADIDVTKTTTVETGDTITGQNTQAVVLSTGGNSATNEVTAKDHSEATGTITTNTGGNTVNPSLTTGSADGANSPAVNNGSDDGVTINVDQNNSAANKATSSGGEDKGDTGALADSAQKNDADIDVDKTTTVNTGDVITGQNTQVVVVDTGGNTGYNDCKAYDHSTVTCTIVFNTGGNTVNPSITTGSADGANSPSVGNTAPPAQHHHHHYYPKPADHHHAAVKPAHHHAAAAPAHHVKRAAPVAHRAAAVHAHAQPKGQLAYTGAETTAPLALGLLALGMGGALTLAGRRRSTTATA